MGGAGKLLAEEGPRGFYRGYATTIAREIPFSAIQFPMYEWMKRGVGKWLGGEGVACPPWAAAACGALCGGFAAGCTTPLDVAKTRMMLGKDAQGADYTGTLNVLKRIPTEEGWAKLFSGIQPRVMWITIGGFVYFGAYEGASHLLLGGASP